MEPTTLQLIWYLLLGVLLAGYAVLDGFDLGVGIMHPFIPRNDHERRVALNAIGPLWDGNEVWLVTFGGALFAAFPDVYATVFSGFYLPFMGLLFALILRAVSIEFRSKRSEPAWRRVWDGCFFLGSTLAAFLFGVAVGNAMIGMRLDATGDFVGGVLSLLSPFAILTGVLALALFAMHGTIYLYLKTEGPYQERIHGWMWRTFGLFLVLFMLTTIFTLAGMPAAIKNLAQHPVLWIIPVANVFAVANIPRAIHYGRPGYAFVSSVAVILALVSLIGLALFPNLVTARPEPADSLTLYNAASSAKTLRIMLIIAAIGIPAVLAYTTSVYWTFRGKVRLDEHSY
jgi:cytochrome d ubiquinol oxidase subunit II